MHIPRRDSRAPIMARHLWPERSPNFHRGPSRIYHGFASRNCRPAAVCTSACLSPEGNPYDRQTLDHDHATALFDITPLQPSLGALISGIDLAKAARPADL